MTKITSSLMFFLYLYLPSYDSFEIKKTEEKKNNLIKTAQIKFAEFLFKIVRELTRCGNDILSCPWIYYYHFFFLKCGFSFTYTT